MTVRLGRLSCVTVARQKTLGLFTLGFCTSRKGNCFNMSAEYQLSLCRCGTGASGTCACMHFDSQNTRVLEFPARIRVLASLRSVVLSSYTWLSWTSFEHMCCRLSSSE